VYPREIEEVILTHPEIVEACVFGIPDAKWGEAVTAHVVVVAGSHLDEAQVRRYLADRLAGFKRPKRIEFVPELAKTPYGKIDKKLIRAAYWEGHDRLVG
jgi:acyl-CoA synthetase (AMP-forming)/AMP-acid ligase II